MIMLDFAGIVHSSTIDYPGKMCAVVYLAGCDFRCPFCHNKDLVTKQICHEVDVSTVIEPLSNNFLIEGVCITGGEPLMQEETIKLIAGLRKNTPLMIKLDTNGSYPERLERVLPALSFVSMDIKAPFEKYSKAIGVDATYIISNVQKSLGILKKCKFMKEARTTIVPGLNDTEEDIVEIAKIVAEYGFNIYSLQQFRPKNTLDPQYENIDSPSVDKMRSLAKLAKSHLPNVRVRVATLEHGFQDIL